MKSLEEKILQEGQVLPGNVLKVGSFLNQQVDATFLKEMAKEARRLFADAGVTKILTVEASGIEFATAVAMAWVPWAKLGISKTPAGPFHTTVRADSMMRE